MNTDQHGSSIHSGQSVLTGVHRWKNSVPTLPGSISLLDNKCVNEENRIQILVNGEPVDLAKGSKVTDLIRNLELAEKRLAIELNLSILPRAHWADTDLQAGDKLEIVHFVGGG